MMHSAPFPPPNITEITQQLRCANRTIAKGKPAHEHESGINHLGLPVADLECCCDFFVTCLCWQESGRTPSYPRAAVTDGHLRPTFWKVDHNLDVQSFDQR